MKRTNGFTLTEMLVVIAVMGLMVVVTAGLAPRIFERAAFIRVRAQLSTDLARAGREARTQAAFGAVTVTSSGDGYSIVVGTQVLTRTLPRPIRVQVREPVRIDAAGRYSGGPVILQGGRHEAAFVIDPILGRARSSGNRSDRSGGGGRTDRPLQRALSEVAGRRWWEPSQKPEARGDGCGAAASGSGDCADGASWDHSGPHRLHFVAAGVPQGGGPADRPTALASLRNQAVGRPNRPDRRVARQRTRRLGMTLVEMLVALAVLGLIFSFGFAILGPALRQGKTLETRADELSDVAAVQRLLPELVQSSVLGQVRATETTAYIKTYLPRVAATPIEIQLPISRNQNGFRLYLDAGAFGATEILASQDPLRWVVEAKPSGARLMLQVKRQRQNEEWSPLAVASTVVNAPTPCSFDTISRACR